jgi:hypothetical protein
MAAQVFDHATVDSGDEGSAKVQGEAVWLAVFNGGADAFFRSHGTREDWEVKMGNKEAAIYLTALEISSRQETKSYRSLSECWTI